LSNLRLTDSQNRYISYGDSTETATQNINFGLVNKDLQFNFIFNNYEYENLNNLKVNFRDYMANISYNWHVSKNISLKPRFTWKNMQPWNYQNYQNLPVANQAIYDGYRTINNRYTVGLVSLYAPSEDIAFTMGGEFFTEDATYQVAGLNFSNGRNKINFSNIAFFGELFYKSRFANITAGVRYDDYSVVNPAVVPRIAITKALEKWHFKALYSASFKAPTIQNIEFSIENKIQPERTNTMELEIGYKINNHTSISANIFDIKIQKPIVYYIDRITFSEGYINLDRTGSQGFELEFKTKPQWGQIHLGYSYYTPQYNQTPNYQLIDSNGNIDRSMYLGVPNHKVTLNTHFKITNKWYVNPMMMYFSKKYTYLYNSNADLLLTSFAPEFHLNLSTYLIATENLKLNLRIYNILGQNLWFINPYNSGDNPIPEHKQEVLLQISYRLTR
jgi:outer membrane cobalamin receptor